MIDVRWPRPGAREGLWERAAVAARGALGFCNVCARPTVFRVRSGNLRETVDCALCGSFNRQRQIAAVLLDGLGPGGRAPAGLDRLPRGLRVWNLEARRALHDALAARLGDGYVGSEYLGPGVPSGAVRGGVLHVDAQRTHFPDASFDVVLSSDVLEHVPRPADAHREIHRVLRPGGRHVFTVPFYEHRFTCETRAEEDGAGGVRHLAEPVYHEDPVRPGGALVFNVFAMELLCDLERVGFTPRLCLVRAPWLGILGANGIVVDARKAAA
jgi:SAM-dependent methyltransferase